MKQKFLFLALAFVSVTSAHAWSGYDYDSGSHVDIEKGNLVRSGRDIEIYDYSKGEYRDVTVESINRRGTNVEVEVTDNETGETRTLDMDKRPSRSKY